MMCYNNAVQFLICPEVRISQVLKMYLPRSGGWKVLFVGGSFVCWHDVSYLRKLQLISVTVYSWISVGINNLVIFHLDENLSINVADWKWKYCATSSEWYTLALPVAVLPVYNVAHGGGMCSVECPYWFTKCFVWRLPCAVHFVSC